MTPLKLVIILLIALFSLASVGYYTYNHVDQVDVNNVKVCFGCHGPNGDIVFNGAPVLAGKDRDYLLMQLKAFQSGQRESEYMSGVLKNYGRRELLEAAHYFSSLPEPEKKENSLYCAGCHVATSNKPLFEVADPH